MKSEVAKWLFLTDLTDGWKRKITGGFWNSDPSYPYKPHAGVDYGADVGEVLVAYDDYEVIGINTGHSDYGEHVFIYLPKINKTALYAHMSRIDIKLGQTGGAQTSIGLSGNTGKSGGPHVHFGLANGRVTSTEKGKHEGDIWLNFETFVYNDHLVSKPSPSLIAEDGVITVTTDLGLLVRKQPSRTSDQIGVVSKGVTVPYTHYVDNDNIRWVKVDGGYMARRMLDNSEVWADAQFAKPVVKNRVGQVLAVRQADYKKATFTAYEDKACTVALRPWTMSQYNHDLTFNIIEDHDPIFKCAQHGKTPLSGIKYVYIKWESGIGFDS